MSDITKQSKRKKEQMLQRLTQRSTTTPLGIRKQPHIKLTPTTDRKTTGRCVGYNQAEQKEKRADVAKVDTEVNLYPFGDKEATPYKTNTNYR
ncbi:hypothetical protein PRVXT_002743 [Proteinivorax tanatarense]|uniref:Uncharacterized protein n=1 Tax=Proteinivorax tanatarense TaxID=1260629 RepID=A0AAU7VKX5_9FIRM